MTNPYSNFGYAVLTAQRAAAPHREALVYAGTERLTYEDFDDRVNVTANALTLAGLRPGDRVATLLRSPLSVAEVYLAQAKVGTVLCALNPYWERATLVAVVRDVAATVFLYDAHFEPLIDEIRHEIPTVGRFIRVGTPEIDLVPASDLHDLRRDVSTAPPPVSSGGDDLLALYFTSGTTGLPKPVRYTHSSAIAVARDLWADVPRSPDASFGTGTIIWGIGFIAVAAPALIAGMRLVLEDGFGPGVFAEVVPRESISHISVTPSFFAELFTDDGFDGGGFESLKVAMLGGEPLLPALQERIQAHFPRLQLFTYYGQTEAPYSAVGRRDDGSMPDGAVGRPRFGGAIRVVDDSGAAVIDEVGEIQLSGPHVTAGYDNRPEATAESLRDGWFVGGDVGSIDRDGHLHVLGRRADAVVRQGVMTLPTQVEDIASRVDGVLEAGATGLVDADGRPRILLVIAVRGDEQRVRTQVLRELESTLPPASCPDHVVVTDALPHANDGSGGRGKLLRRRLVEYYDDRESVKI
jgi:acyl-CoA synthetase (AMP-forming)/AMP-acid ligase II